MAPLNLSRIVGSPSGKAHDIRILTRVVDYGGIFHDDVRPGHSFGPQDHRAFRPAGWVEAGVEKLIHLRPIAAKHNLTPLQLAAAWNLAQPAVESVIPTLIQEIGDGSRTIESKVDDLAGVKRGNLSTDELERIAHLGNNFGSMALKGAKRGHTTDPLPDQWNLDADLESVAERWGIHPDTDLIYTH